MFDTPLQLTENAIKVLEKRYLRKDEQGKCIERPEDMFKRVALAIADGSSRYAENNVAQKASDYYHLMVSGKFLPNSPTLMNAGRELGMLSGCFVLPFGDSIDEIFDTVKDTALVQRAGGGTGFCLDRLRPTGDFIMTSGGQTSGPLSFWDVLAAATTSIQQGAFRRGANMMMIGCSHPDLLKFIFAKQDLSRYTNFNISVKISDAFMTALRERPTSPLTVTNRRTGISYFVPREFVAKDITIHNYRLQDLLEASSEPAVKVWTYSEVWDVICKNAWTTGEPGACFIDTLNAANPTPLVGEYEATNPCGEQALLPNEACNLGSINLGLFVDNDGNVNWHELRKTVRLATRLLEDVVEVNNYPTLAIDSLCRANRKIGLGVMGFADALFKLGVSYASDEGVEWGERFMAVVNDEAHNESQCLAEERGVFSNWKGSRWELEWKRKQRNACSTTVAPTGTISIIANCSGGIEPLYCLSFKRQVMPDHTGKLVEMREVNEKFKQVATEAKFWGMKEDELYARIEKEGSIAHIDTIPEKVRNVFVCAHDVTPEWHVRMQAAFQRHCDSSISKTINMAETAAVDDVKKVYNLAYDLKCKGITVYRNNCRANQPMTLATPSAPKLAKTPEILSSLRLRQNTPFGHMHINVSVDPVAGKELEVFAQLGRGGEIAAADLEAICRMVSIYLRRGGTVKDVVNQLEGIGTTIAIPTKDGRVTSLGDGLAKALKRYMLLKEKHGLEALLLGKINVDATVVEQQAAKTADAQYKMLCPECGVGELKHESKCVSCTSCGYSKCG